MNTNTLHMNNLRLPSNFFHKARGDQHIAFEVKTTTPPPMTITMNMAMTMAMTTEITTDGDYPMEDCDSLTDCTPPPLLEQQRSSSPRSVSDMWSSVFSGKDFHVVADTNNVDDVDHFIDPLPLASSASTDMMHLFKDYFNQDIVKEVLPKTKLTFYEDRAHKMDDIGIDEIEDEMKDAEEKTDLFLERRRILDDFPLTKDSGEYDDPFKFFVSTKTLPISELPKPSVENHKRNEDQDANMVPKQTRKTKPASKTKAPIKKKTTHKKIIAAKRGIAPKKTVAGRKKVMITSKKPIVATKKITISSKKPIAARAANPDPDGLMEETWELHYKNLKVFYDKNKHSCVLRSDPDQKLSGWVKRQRNNLKSGRLSPSQIQRLDDLNFVWNRLEESWMSKYNLLKAHVWEFGTTDVTSGLNRSLAEWVQRQRREYRLKKKTMTKARIQKLEGIQTWSWVYQSRSK